MYICLYLNKCVSISDDMASSDSAKLLDISALFVMDSSISLALKRTSLRHILTQSLSPKIFYSQHPVHKQETHFYVNQNGKGQWRCGAIKQEQSSECYFRRGHVTLLRQMT